MRRTASLVGTGLVAAVVAVALIGRRSAAQDNPAGETVAPTAMVDKAMVAIGNGQADDAVTAMAFMAVQQDERDAARRDILALRDSQLGNYHGYDLAQTVPFTPRFEALDVVGYFDRQPVLFRYEFYRPQENGPWTVLTLKIDPTEAGMVEVLREDAPGVGVGRGGRATR
jgi:hypothetical protein